MRKEKSKDDPGQSQSRNAAQTNPSGPERSFLVLLALPFTLTRFTVDSSTSMIANKKKREESCLLLLVFRRGRCMNLKQEGAVVCGV